LLHAAQRFASAAAWFWQISRRRKTPALPNHASIPALKAVGCERLLGGHRKTERLHVVGYIQSEWQTILSPKRKCLTTLPEQRFVRFLFLKESSIVEETDQLELPKHISDRL